MRTEVCADAEEEKKKGFAMGSWSVRDRGIGMAEVKFNSMHCC